MAELRENLAKKKLLSGDSCVVLMGLDNADAIDQYGPGSHDGIWLEGEHGGVGFDEITKHCALGYRGQSRRIATI